MQRVQLVQTLTIEVDQSTEEHHPDEKPETTHGSCTIR